MVYKKIPYFYLVTAFMSYKILTEVIGLIVLITWMQLKIIHLNFRHDLKPNMKVIPQGTQSVNIKYHLTLFIIEIPD